MLAPKAVRQSKTSVTVQMPAEQLAIHIHSASRRRLVIEESSVTVPDPEPGLRVDWLRFDGRWPDCRPEVTGG